MDSVADANEPNALSTALNNRAAAHLKLGNYGYALSDALKAGQLAPLNVKAHYRYVTICTKALNRRYSLYIFSSRPSQQSFQQTNTKMVVVG